MAHELNIEDGKASMFYTGPEPWHKLGTKLDKPATSVEAIKGANLDWEVTKIPLYGIHNSNIISSRKFGTVRKDKLDSKDCEIFGVVSNQYVPVQNVEAFRFFDSIVGSGSAIYHTAGALGNGERIWILAKLPNDIVIKNKDNVEKFLLLSNSHDGTRSVEIKFTPIRVVCQNTLNQALSSDVKPIKISHQGNVVRKLSDSKEILGIVQTTYKEIEQLFNQMSDFRLNNGKADEYFELLFPFPKEINSEADEKEMNAKKKLRENTKYYFESGRGNSEESVMGTLWTAYNGVAEYIDHHRKLRNTTDRTTYLLYGTGNDIKLRALEVAKEMLKRK